MTLLFYIVIGFISVLFIFVAENLTSRKAIINNDKTVFINATKKRSYFFIILSFLTLFLVAALRDGVGTDYETYSRVFIRINNNMMTQSDKNWISLGFELLCRFVGLFDKNNYVLMFAVVSALTLFFYYRAICSFSINWALSLYLILCFCLYYQTFNQARQGLAISLVAFSFVYLKKDNLKMYIATIILATLIHTSAIVMLIFLVVRKMKINRSTKWFYLVGCIGCYFGFNLIVFLLSFTNYGKTYLNWDKYNTSFELSSIMNLIVRLIFLIVCMMYYKKTIKRAPYTLTLYHSIIICTIMQVLTLKSYLFGRVTIYFFVAYIFLIPEVVKTVKETFSKSQGKVITIFVYLIFALYHFVYYFSPSGASGSGYAEYKSLLLNIFN